MEKSFLISVVACIILASCCEQKVVPIALSSSITPESSSTATSTPTKAQSTKLPSLPTSTSLPTANATTVRISYLNVPKMLGKPIDEVEKELGKPELIFSSPPSRFPNCQDVIYRIGQYSVQVTYDTSDSQYLLRVFVVLPFSSDETYSIDQWKSVLPKFGIDEKTRPDFKTTFQGNSQTRNALYWENNNGYFVKFVASETADYAWSLKISEVEYKQLLQEQ